MLRYEVQVDGGAWQDLGFVAADIDGKVTLDVTDLPTPETQYAFKVRAADASSNIGEPSAQVLESTLVSYGNVAFSGRGAVASASSVASFAGPGHFDALRANNGFRYTTNFNSLNPLEGLWIADGDPATSPEWLEVDFGASRTIDAINVWSLASALDYSTEPGPTDVIAGPGTGPVDFLVQYWDGAAWQTISTVTGNTLVLYQTTFTAVVTQKIRIYVTAGFGGGVAIVELEAFGV